MAGTRKPSTEDIELFRRSVGPVRKLKQDKVQSRIQRPAPRPRRPEADEELLHRNGFSEACYSDDVSAEDTLFHARPGLQRRLLQRLRRGQLAIGAELDMHGMTIAAAQEELSVFLGLCSNRRIRCIRIIHGKGYGSRHSAPVLKNRLNNWLRQHPDVLAFSSAPREQGGSGAVNVLLRTRR